jgi:hypothetical protein
MLSQPTRAATGRLVVDNRPRPARKGNGLGAGLNPFDEPLFRNRFKGIGRGIFGGDPCALLLECRIDPRAPDGDLRSRNAVKPVAYWTLLDVSRASIGARRGITFELLFRLISDV